VVFGAGPESSNMGGSNKVGGGSPNNGLKLEINGTVTDGSIIEPIYQPFGGRETGDPSPATDAVTALTWRNSPKLSYVPLQSGVPSFFSGSSTENPPLLGPALTSGRASLYPPALRSEGSELVA
jgi:hypothetical protein